MTIDPLPFSELLGIELRSVTPERVEAELKVREELCTRPAVLHGGALMAFADTLGAIATVQNLPEGTWTTTIESKTNFFTAIPAGRGGDADAIGDLGAGLNAPCTHFGMPNQVATSSRAIRR